MIIARFIHHGNLTMALCVIIAKGIQKIRWSSECEVKAKQELRQVAVESMVELDTIR